LKPLPAGIGFCSGIFSALIPMPFFFIAHNFSTAELKAQWWMPVGALVISLLCFVASKSHTRKSLIAAGIPTLGGIAFLALQNWWHIPAAALVIGTFVVGLLFLIVQSESPSSKIPARPNRSGEDSRVRGALLVSALSGLACLLLPPHVSIWFLGASSTIGFLWLVRTLVRSLRHLKNLSQENKKILVVLICVAIFAFSLFGDWPTSLGLFGVGSGLAAIFLPRSLKPDMLVLSDESWLSFVLENPARLLGITFLFLCAGGTLLLLLPWSAQHGVSISAIDALFTAVSAVCVTGLNVLDTPLNFSFFGQAMIVLLIQVGGLGIMTFSTAAIRLLGSRMSMKHESTAAGLLSAEDRSSIFDSAKTVLKITFGAEALGAIGLSTAFFLHGDTFFMAVWRGIFTAVSAFCNAGFALQSDNLVSFQNHPFVLHTVALLIITGGISPLLIASLSSEGFKKRRLPKLSAQAGIVIFATLFLLFFGFIFLLVNEWNGTLESLSFMDRIHNAWFQSVTTRTAGFNSIAIENLKVSSQTVMMILMFIGGSPGGTAGGIKTTTAGILVLAAWAAIKGRTEIEVFRKHISYRTVYRAAAIATAGLIVTFVAAELMFQTQHMSPRVALFEVISALGTVGLTAGGTSQLDEVGKVLISTCMFLGRVGPLSLFLFLTRKSLVSTWKRIEEDVDVG
jgi:trk system potassium uptake protein TrkH